MDKSYLSVSLRCHFLTARGCFILTGQNKWKLCKRKTLFYGVVPGLRRYLPQYALRRVRSALPEGGKKKYRNVFAQKKFHIRRARFPPEISTCTLQLVVRLALKWYHTTHSQNFRDIKVKETLQFGSSPIFALQNVSSRSGTENGKCDTCGINQDDKPDKGENESENFTGASAGTSEKPVWKLSDSSEY